MRISQLFAAAGGGTPARPQRPTVSFEFFPPRTDAGYASLFGVIAELKDLEPSFVSVTWGAGGSTRRKTVELVERIQRETGITAMAHLTCIDSTPEDISQTLGALHAGGLQNVLALRGDEPPGYVAPGSGLRHASDLVSHIRSGWDFCVGAACYPETHPGAESPDADLAHLARKVQCGVDFLITQFFFDNDDYFRFLERAARAGIQAPIIAGIMPVVSASGIRRMAKLSGARLPERLRERIERCGEDDRAILEVGVEWSIAQCADLLRQEVAGLHFYTLNRSPATRRVYREVFPG